jgi:hypothetical protein
VSIMKNFAATGFKNYSIFFVPPLLMRSGRKLDGQEVAK